MTHALAALGGLGLGVAAATWWWRRIFDLQDHTIGEQGAQIDELKTLAARAAAASEEAQRRLKALQSDAPGVSMATIVKLADIDEPRRRFILKRAAADLEALVQEHAR